LHRIGARKCCRLQRLRRCQWSHRAPEHRERRAGRHRGARSLDEFGTIERSLLSSSLDVDKNPESNALIGILASRMAIATAEHAMKNQLTLGMVAGFLWIWASVSAPTFAAEPCGLWSEVPREGSDLIRFRKLKEFDGHAFLDMETCLIWQLDLLTDVQTLVSAAHFCAVKGQGGPNGASYGVAASHPGRANEFGLGRVAQATRRFRDG
jgi:hypothetical protein